MGPQPRLFRYSLDWRFLLPLTDPQSICLLLEEDQDFGQALEQVGIQTSQQFSFSDLKQLTTNDIQSLVMPFGIPAGWVSEKPEDQVAFYDSLRRLISSGGYLLVGFRNTWSPGSTSRGNFYACTPRRVSYQLRQAGFGSIKLFGAMPSLTIPEYIFDLDSRTIQFALQNRFRRKPTVLRALQVMSATIGWRGLSNFLPCYFALASA